MCDMITKQNRIFEIETNFGKFRSSGCCKPSASGEKFLLEGRGQLPRPLKSHRDGEAASAASPLPLTSLTLTHAQSHTYVHTLVQQGNLFAMQQRHPTGGISRGRPKEHHQKLSSWGRGTERLSRCQWKHLSFRHKSCHRMWLLLGNSDSPSLSASQSP